MGASIAAAFYAGLGILISYFIMFKSEFDDIGKRAFAIWFGLVGPIFFIGNIFLLLVVALVSVILISPRNYSDRAAFFIVALPAVPGYFSTILPFPGLNYLIDLTYWKLIVVGVLLPLLFRQKEPGGTTVEGGIIDSIVVIYIVFISALTFEALPPTSVLRFTIDQILLIIIPYFVLSRNIISIRHLEKCVYCFLVVAIILGSIGVVSEVKKWDFYRLREIASVFTIPDFRVGLLRLGITTNSTTLGIIMTIGLISLEYCKSRFNISVIKTLTIRTVLFVTLVSTVSRGVYLAVIIAYLCYFFIASRRSVTRFAIAASAAGAIGALIVWRSSLDFSKIDEYGTFDYRNELLLASFKQISEHPMLGDPKFLTSGNFDHLVQGQGIIDITNLYLQVVLTYGLVGLILFLCPFVFSLNGLYRRCRRLRSRSDGLVSGELKIYALLTSSMVAYLILIATTSDVALIPHVGVVILALARASLVITSEFKLARGRSRASVIEPRPRLQSPS